MREKLSIDSGWRGFYARDVRRAKARALELELGDSKCKASTDGRRMPFASYKPESPEKKRKEKKKGSFGAFSSLVYCQGGVIIVTGQNRVY